MNCAVIVAAGKGTRMGPDVDKLFLEVAGRPVITHTWQRFDDAKCIHHIILVVRQGGQTEFQKMADQFGFKKPFALVVGGAERQDSVWQGLEALPAGAELVAIHDGARPCASEALIEATLAAARETGAAVAAQKVTDTVKESADGLLISRNVDRARLWSVQTPQAFRVAIIRQALAEVKKRGVHVTDDTAACEWIGQPVRLVAVGGPNPKVTLPGDLAMVQALLART
jgi:2-C-methyl-D-erythritol 4-phosphate cytidylyltransferase